MQKLHNRLYLANIVQALHPKHIYIMLHLDWLNTDFINAIRTQSFQNKAANFAFFDNLTKIAQLPKPHPTALLRHTFAAALPSPTAQIILDNLGESRDILATGKPTPDDCIAFLSNALSNGLKCWIVSDDTALLQHINDWCAAVGWGDLVANLHTQTTDNLLATLRPRLRASHLRYPMPASLVRVLQSAANTIQHWRQFAQQLQTPILTASSYSEAIAKWLEYAPNVAINLRSISYKYTIEEYEKLILCLRECQPLYEQLGTFQHPFNALDDRFFRQAHSQQIAAEALETIERVLFVVDAATRDMLSYLYQYEVALDTHFTELFADHNDLINSILEESQTGAKLGKYVVNQHKKLHEKLSGVWGNLTGNQQQLETCQQKIIAAHDKLRHLHLKYFCVSHTIARLAEDTTFEALAQDMETFQQKLVQWFSNRETLIQSHVQQLSPDNIHPQSQFQTRIADLTINLNNFVQKLAQARLFKLPFQFQNANIRQRAAQLEQLQKNIQLLKNQWNEFEAYHALKFCWLHYDDLQRQTIQLLAASQSKHWATDFEAAYWQQCLQIVENQGIPTESTYHNSTTYLHKDLTDSYNALREFVPLHWQGKQSEAIKTLQNQFDINAIELYQQSEIAQILAQDTSIFTTFYPIILATPAQIVELFPTQLHLTDMLIIDQAERLPLPAYLPLAVLAKLQIAYQQNAPFDIKNTTTNLLHNADSYAHLLHFLQSVYYIDCHKNLPTPAPNTLADWIAPQLQKLFPTATIQQHIFIENNLYIPLIINQNNQQIAIYIDIFAQATPDDAYDWDIHLAHIVQRQPMHLIRTWSHAWHNNAQQALAQLQQKIISIINN